jgi:hypothetical protein
MPVIRKFAVQGHAVPNGYQRPRGPFPPEILAQTRVVYDEQHPDSLHEALDDVRMFRCRDCAAVLLEEQTYNHDCESEN